MDDTRSAIAHLYRRAGFGARPDELDAATASGYEATVESLLAGLRGPDPAGDKVALPQLTYEKTAPSPQQRMAINQEYQALQAWWLNRMIVTSTPLREKLTLLWHGHFATAFEKVRSAAFMYRQNQLFRTLGAGNFETLTQAVAKDPAMMRWLDTQTNVAGKPNENFARELLELFTLGLGAYRENDVKDAARSFTGWAFDRSTGDYLFRARLHDSAAKTFLDQTGPFNGEDVVRIATRNPASARWIVAKLWSHLAYPVGPDDPIVVDLAAGYGRDLDITNLLRATFLRAEFTSPAARTGLIKQPIEYVVGIARAFGLDAAGQPTGGKGGRSGAGLAAGLRLLAQEPFNPPNVGGWPQNEYWLTTATAQGRLQYGLLVAANGDLSALSGPAAGRPAALAHLLSIDGWGPTTAAALNHAVTEPAGLVAIALSAPEYVLN